MGTDFWIRNPTGCAREVIAAGENKIVFDAGYIGKRGVDPRAFMSFHFGTARPYEYMIIREHGAMHFCSDDPDRQVGVYPVWNASTDSMSFLEEWCVNPVGENMALCSDHSVDEQQRPILGQEHRIIIHGLPDAKTMSGKQALQSLHYLSVDYPDVKLVIHGTYIFMPLIALRFAEFTAEPREAAVHKKVFLPNGRKVVCDDTLHRYKKWIELLGFSLGDLQIPARRCEFNIRAFRWACHHGLTPTAFLQKPSEIKNRPDPKTPNIDYQPRDGGLTLALTSRKAKPGDKMDCNSCSLADQCKYFREGAVCTLPGSEMSDLAKLFDTTDTTTILSGMARLTALSAERAERAMGFEDSFGLDPEVTKMLKQTFDFAERYAKLNDPMLRATVNFNQNGKGEPQPVGATRPVPLTPTTAAAAAIEYYESKGIPRASITREMMGEFIRSQTQPTPELESGEVAEAEVVSE